MLGACASMASPSSAGLRAALSSGAAICRHTSTAQNSAHVSSVCSVLLIKHKLKVSTRLHGGRLKRQLPSGPPRTASSPPLHRTRSTGAA